MAATGLNTFDRTLQTTHIWLDELIRELGPDRQTAWHALGAVLRALRDRLPLGLAVHLGAQLPLLVRGTYYERWRPLAAEANSRSADEFLHEIAQDLTTTRPLNPRSCAEAVFRVLSRHVEVGQVENVRQALPEAVRVMWPAGQPVNPVDAAGQLVQLRDAQSADDPIYYIVAERDPVRAEQAVKAAVARTEQVKAVGPVTSDDLDAFGLKSGQFTPLRPAP